MREHQPAAKGGKGNAAVQKRCDGDRWGFGKRQNQQVMAERAHGADQAQLQPLQGGDVGGPPAQHQHAGHHRAHQARVKVQGHGVFGFGHVAGQGLKAGIRHHHHQGQPGVFGGHAAAWAHDQHGAQHAAHHKHPTQRGHMLVHDKTRQQRDRQGRQHTDGGELCHGHALQADEGQQAASHQQQAAQNLQADVACVENCQAALGQHHGAGGDRLKHVAHPQDHQQGDASHQDLVGGVQYRKAGHGGHGTEDARQRDRGLH